MNLDDIVDWSTWKVALQKWPLLALTFALSFLLAVLTCAVVPHQYQVTATVVGTRYQSDITPSDQATAFSAAALLGSNTNDLPAITDFRLYTELLQSPELGSLIVNDPVMHRVFWKSWRNGHWAAPDSLSMRARSALGSLTGQSPWHPPDGFDVARYLKAHVSVTQAKDAKIATLSTWNTDPQLGKDLILLVSLRADSMVKDMAQKRFKAKVEFLEKVLSTATVQETRTAMGAALARAETDEIYSFSTLPFAAEFVALPDSPSESGFPQFWLIFGIFIVFGIFIFLAYILLLKQRSASMLGVIASEPRSHSDAHLETTVP